MLGKLAIDKLAQPLVDVYVQMEQDMLVTMAEKLKGKNDLLAKDPEAWKLQQMNYLGMLDRDNLNTIRKYAGLSAALLNKMLYNAMIDGMDQTDGAMEKAIKDGAKLRVPKPISEEPQILNILKAYQDQAANVLNLTNQTMVKSAKKIYVDVLNRSVADVVSGFKTPDQAIRRTVGMWADQGIPALIDKAGKKWGPEGYVRTVVVTTTHNTVHKMQDTRFSQWGVHLVEVSSHAGARPLCAPYQGKIYKIDGNNTKYKNLYTDTSYGQPAGLFGINCGHYKYPFIEGVNTQTYFPYDKENNDKTYKESQQQRAIERGIRNAKNKVEMYKAMGDDQGVKEATALVKQRQANLRKFIDDTGRTRRRDREQIVTKPITAQSTPDHYTELMKQKEKDLKKQQKEIEKQNKQVEKEMQVPNPVHEPHIPQTTTQPVIEQIVHEPSKHEPVTKVEPLLKSVDQLTIGDKVSFAQKGFKEDQVGHITEDNGKMFQVQKQNGNFVNIKKENIITHIPEENKLVPQVETTKSIQVGDTLKFKDMWGDAKTGTIKSMSDSGYDVYDGHDTHFVESGDIIEHTPQNGGNENWSPATFKQLNSSDVDILKDRQTFEKMPQKDVAIVHKYTTSYYSEMNGFLRAGVNSDNSKLIKEVEHLQEVIKNNAKPMTENIRLFRKFNQRAINTVFGEGFDTLMMDAVKGGNNSQAALELNDKLVGGAFEDKGFVSSTYVQGSYGSGSDVNIDMFVPQGYNGGMFVESISEFKHEKEYLFNSGVLFDIQDVDFSNQQITIKVIPRIPTASQ
jgi:hypothetical protein